MKNPDIVSIQKEEIPTLSFPREEVLNTKDQQSERCSLLKTAMRLGNLERQKVRVLFSAKSGLKQVETTVWGVTDKAVILKQSIVLPLNRILAVS